MTPAETNSLPPICGTLIPTPPEDIPAEQQNFNVMYAGFPKTGKTHCLGSWPDPLVIYTDHNTATIRKHGVPFVPVRDWPTFKNHIIPALEKRSWFSTREDGEVELVPFSFRSLVVDTATTLADYLLDYLINTRRLEGYELWGQYLGDFMSAMRTVVSMATPSSDSPSCNVLVGCHLHDVLNSSGHVAKTQLDISGRSAVHLPKLFDTILLCRSQPVNADKQNPQLVTGAEYFCHTLNPSRFIEFVGGEGSKYNKLPPKTGGTFAELMAAWGVPQSD